MPDILNHNLYEKYLCYILVEEDSHHLLMGNEAVARGVVEAGVRFAIGYPGTPSTEVLENLSSQAKKSEMRVEWAVNEKVAFDIATGVSYSGKRCLATMKSAGLNVALDSIVSVAYSDIIGGLVIYVADDPSAHAGMEEQDSRLLTDVTGIPMMDVYDPQSSKEAIIEAFNLSEKHRIPVIVRSTSRIAHGKAPVKYSHVQAADDKPSLVRNISRYTRASPAWVKQQHRDLLEKVENMVPDSEASQLNALKLVDGAEAGVIGSGAAWTYLQDVIDAHSLEISTLLLGYVKPLPLNLIERMITNVDRVLVLEELEPFIEQRVRALAQSLECGVKILGKTNGRLSRVGEYDYQIVEDAVGSLLGRQLSQRENVLNIKRQKARKLAPARSLPFCAGCPHRGTYTALTQAAKELGYSEGEVIVTGDIGCTILGMYPPWNSCWTEVCMGASIGNAIGFRYGGVKAPIVAAIGDSTFFHAGLPPMINTAWRDAPIVIAVLDNRITGMTGHQPSPSSGYNEKNEETRTVMAEDLLTAAGITHVQVVDPYNLEDTRNAFKKALSDEVTSAVVLRRACSLVARRRGISGTPYMVDDSCTGCLTCIHTLSCPAMTLNEGVALIDETQCTGCGLCEQVCPVGAIKPAEVS
jgi:indolepyruvate ferredoxin oxidoreductase alpha subunit